MQQYAGKAPLTIIAGTARAVQKGIASWYGRNFHGRSTANGERFDMHALSAAHPTLPMASYVRVRNLENQREVIVRINDRGPFHGGRIIDLSYAAAHQLDMVRGLGNVVLELLTGADLRAARSGRGAGTMTAEGAEPVATVASADAHPVDVPFAFGAAVGGESTASGNAEAAAAGVAVTP